MGQQVGAISRISAANNLVAHPSIRLLSANREFGDVLHDLSGFTTTTCSEERAALIVLTTAPPFRNSHQSEHDDERAFSSTLMSGQSEQSAVSLAPREPFLVLIGQ